MGMDIGFFSLSTVFFFFLSPKENKNTLTESVTTPISHYHKKKITLHLSLSYMPTFVDIYTYIDVLISHTQSVSLMHLSKAP